MMTGEFDFQDIFFSHFESDAYQDGLEYETTSFAIFVIFVLSMSLLMTNLLVSFDYSRIQLIA